MVNEDIAGIVNLDQKALEVLDSSNFMLSLGIPVTKEVLGGEIGGSPANTEFTTRYPIYPASGKTKAPVMSDITAYTRKEGSPDVDTEVTVSAIETGEDEDTGYTVYNTVVLASAPASETADNVLLDYHAYNDIYTQQSIKPKIDQNTDDLERMGSRTVYTKYGNIKSEIEVEVAISDLKQILLGFQAESDQTGVEAGYVLYKQRSIPQILKGFIPIYSGDETDDPIDREEMGRIILNSVQIPPSLPEGKVGDNATVTLTLSIGSELRILAKEET